MNERDRFEILLEDVNGKFDAVIEYVKDIPEIKERVTRLEDKFDNVEMRTDVLESVVKEHSSEISALKQS